MAKPGTRTTYQNTDAFKATAVRLRVPKPPRAAKVSEQMLAVSPSAGRPVRNGGSQWEYQSRLPISLASGPACQQHVERQAKHRAAVTPQVALLCTVDINQRCDHGDS
jgi:hypothetical protein